MLRKVIKIDRDRCNGCGLCASACHESAITIVGGKAELISESFCDGLGDCLPACPEGAISFEERDIAAYDPEAVKAAACSCQGAAPKTLVRDISGAKPDFVPNIGSQLAQWPCQIKLAPLSAEYFKSADLLIAADCTAYAYANVHTDFMRGKVTLIGCPKLDGEDYADKLSEIIGLNDIKSVTVLRMEVPCCGGIESMAKRALILSGKSLPINTVIIKTNGELA